MGVDNWMVFLKYPNGYSITGWFGDLSLTLNRVKFYTFSEGWGRADLPTIVKYVQIFNIQIYFTYIYK